MSGEPPVSIAFAATALTRLRFLRDLGYFPVVESDNSVLFESNDTLLRIYRDERSWHIGLEIGRRGHAEKFTLNEILHYLNSDNFSLLKMQINKESALEDVMARLSRFLETNCGSLLSGSSSAFLGLSQESDKIRSRDTLLSQFGPTIMRADIAWRGKKWAEACDLYQTAYDALDDTRRRRLAFLRRKASAN